LRGGGIDLETEVVRWREGGGSSFKQMILKIYLYINSVNKKELKKRNERLVINKKNDN